MTFAPNPPTAVVRTFEPWRCRSSALAPSRSSATAALGYDQKLRRLAALATESIEYPMLSEACREALDKRVICDMYEGNAPYTARYVLPDYAKAMAAGFRTSRTGTAHHPRRGARRSCR